MSEFYPHFRNADSALSHAYVFPVVDAFLHDLPPGSKVLDLGCGNGALLGKLQDRPWKLYGTDLSEVGLRFAQQAQAQIHFFLSDISKISSDEIVKECGGPVDAIISTEVVEHLYLPRVFAQLCFESLKPGGRIVLSTPYHGYAKNLALSLAGKMDAHHGPLWDYGHIKFWSRKSLAILLTEAGFEDLKFYGSGRLPYLWKSMLFSAQKPA